MPSDAVSCTSSAQVGVGEGSDGPGGGVPLWISPALAGILWLMICACLCAPSLCVAYVFSAGMSTCQEAQEVNTQTRLVGALRVYNLPGSRHVVSVEVALVRHGRGMDHGICTRRSWSKRTLQSLINGCERSSMP